MIERARSPEALATFPGILRGAWRERLSRGLAITVLALAPLPFGSLHTAWIACWTAVMALSLAIASIDSRAPTTRLFLFGAAGIAALVMLVVAVQMTTGRLADPIWQQALALLDQPLPPIPSASRLQPVVALGAMLLLVATFSRFLLLAQDPATGRRMLALTGYIGLAYALFGAASFIFDPTSILGQPKTAYRSNLTGTFVNRNNAATFFGSITIIWLMLLASAVRRAQRGQVGLRDWIWLLATGRLPRVAWRFTAFVICLGVTAATASRAGFILTILMLALCLSLYVRPSRKRSRLLPLGAPLLAVVLAGEFVGGSVGGRLHLLGFDDEGRFEVYAAGLDLLLSRPWLGIGLGNFPAVFPSVRPETVSMVGVWDRAHSSPLEIAIELGIPAFCLIALVWLAFLARLAWLAHRGREVATIAPFAVALFGTLHSFVDFPLQAPGYAVLFAAVVGIGLARQGPEATPPERASSLPERPTA